MFKFKITFNFHGIYVSLFWGSQTLAKAFSAFFFRSCFDVNVECFARSGSHTKQRQAPGGSDCSLAVTVVHRAGGRRQGRPVNHPVVQITMWWWAMLGAA